MASGAVPDVDDGAEIARRLYAEPIDAFIAARNALARELKNAGDTALARQVIAFRKPSVAADVANRLVRHDTALVEDVRQVGRRLRSARAASDAGELRALDRARRSLVVRSGDAAGAVTAATRREIEQTFWAALVDAGAFAALRSGHLVRTLSPSGFGAVDITGATAVPVEIDDEDAVEVAAAPAARRRPRENLNQLLDGARAALRTADERHAHAEQQATESRQRIANAKQELAHLRARIVSVEEDLRAALREEARRRDSLQEAERARRTAVTAVDRARRRLEADD